MPLFSHRHSPSLPTSSSKTIKPNKPVFTPPSSRYPLHLLVFSLVSLLIGLAAIIFAISAVRRSRPLPVFRCGRSEDTFREFYSSSGSNKLGDNNEALNDRPKLLGFVGIQTGFASVNRREALRSTWFPSDPDGLLRYVVIFFYWIWEILRHLVFLIRITNDFATSCQLS